MSRSRYAVILTLASFLIGSVTTRALRAQVLSITVRDSVEHQLLGAAIVSVVDQKGKLEKSGVTTAAAILNWRLTTPGTYAISVRKLGFAPQSSEWFTVASADTVSKEILLQRMPQYLAGVTIRRERDSIRDAKFFGLRIGSLGAVVITPSQVDRALPGANTFTDIVSRNPSPGISVDHGRKCILSNRGYPSTCLPVIVDGLLAKDAEDIIPPETIDYMFIVRGNELGVMYGSIGELGAVLIFTKKGLKRGPPEQ